jgi:hypothetical protein
MGFEKTRTVHFEWRNERPEAFGYKFKSKAELKWAKYLTLLVNSMFDDTIGWRYEPKKFTAKKLRWDKLRYYTPDFECTHGPPLDGIYNDRRYIEWHEVKTSLRQKDVTRFRWFRADYPQERIVLVLTSKPTRSVKQKRLLDNARKYVDGVIFAGPILRKLGL